MGFSKAWIEVLNAAKDFSFSNNSSVTWYRGHSDSDYKLHSGLFRNKFKNMDEYENCEAIYYRKFKNFGHSHHNEKSWNLLYLMQHHGVETRLLDWSESFATALFFAVKNWGKEKDACIWMLNPTELNRYSLNQTQFWFPDEKGSYEELLFEKEKEFLYTSVALFPIRNNPRLINQQGVFTLQGNSLEPLEEEGNKFLIEKGFLKKITITRDMKKDIKFFLKLSGVNEYTMFPDLDGLAKHIHSKF